MKTSRILFLGMIVLLICVGFSCPSFKKGGDKGLDEKQPELLPDDLKAESGCCLPFCRETSQSTCINYHGGSWEKGSCQQQDQCQDGCCLPHCVEETKEMCEQSGGTWYAESCRDFEECQLGCCTPQCYEETKEICEQLAGEWHAKVLCDSIEDCQEGCCAPHGSIMTKFACEMVEGEWMGEDCPGFTFRATAQDTFTTIDGSVAHYEFSLDGYSCGESIQSDWTAHSDWFWKVTGPEGSTPDITHADDYQFTVDPAGSFTIMYGDNPAQGQLTENSVTFRFYMGPSLGDITATGVVKRGAAECMLED